MEDSEVQVEDNGIKKMENVLKRKKMLLCANIHSRHFVQFKEVVAGNGLQTLGRFETSSQS